jgi:hypothetical protein
VSTGVDLIVDLTESFLDVRIVQPLAPARRSGRGLIARKIGRRSSVLSLTVLPARSSTHLWFHRPDPSTWVRHGRKAGGPSPDTPIACVNPLERSKGTERYFGGVFGTDPCPVVLPPGAGPFGGGASWSAVLGPAGYPPRSETPQ